jgi:hypothetical protein
MGLRGFKKLAQGVDVARNAGHNTHIDNATESDMNAAATKETANIIVTTALEGAAKKCGVTVSQVLCALVADAESGDFSQTTRAFMQLRTAAEDFFKSGEAHEFLKMAA